jgi:hypothetical protein
MHKDKHNEGCSSTAPGKKIMGLTGVIVLFLKHQNAEHRSKTFGQRLT